MRIGWYSELNTNERRTYLACFWSYALESMDAQMFAIAIPALITFLGINRGTAGTIGTAALVGGLVGGPLGGFLADRIGRIRVLQLTIVWVAGWTFLSAFTNSAPELIGARFMQGIGYGAESAIGAVLISEAIAPRLRGRIASSIQSAYAVGYAMAVGLMPVVFTLFAGPVGWRVLFAIGVAPALFIVWIRRFVPESPIYAERARAAVKEPSRWTELFAAPYLWRTVFATMQALGTLGAAYVSIIWLPTYLRTVLHLEIASTTGFLMVNILGSFTGPLVYGLVSDRLGRRRGVQLFLLCQAAVMSTFTMAPVGPAFTLVLAFFQGGLQAGLASAMLPAFSELFPTRMRGSGQGFCLSGGRGLGSVVPTAVGYLSLTLPLGYAMGICALCGYVLAFVAVLFLPETVGADLHGDPVAADAGPLGTPRAARP